MYSDFGQICDGFGAESFSGQSGISRVQTIAPDVVSVAETEHTWQDDQRMSNSDNTEKRNARLITNFDTKSVKISTPTSKEHLFTISSSLTFQQLLMDASSYWSLPAAQVVLCDQKGSIWPLLEPVMTTLALTENLEKNVILDIKQSSWASSFAHLEEACTSNPDQVDPITPQSISSTLYDDLWGIFTFYCVQGGNLQVDLMKAHQFTKLLQDCHLLNKVVKLEVMSMISKCEINGKAQINFEEFLNLITRITKLARAKDFKCVQDCNNEEEALYRLVFDQILPRASRWPIEQWDTMTTKLREPEVIMFLFGHLKPLLTIFIFYARSYHTNPSTGMREFYMSYQNLQRFINDFLFAKLQISTLSCAQVFLAACSSRPFHLSESHDVNQCSKMLHLESSCPKSFIAVKKDADETRMATIRNLIAASGVVVAYTVSVTSESRKTCMGFSAFIDFLGRASFTAYTKSKPIAPVLCVKALIHHLCSEATNARVMEIIENHGSNCIHGNTFYLGTAAFRTKFFATWKEEGFPDYLTADVHHGRRTDRLSSHLEPRKSQSTALLGKPVLSASQSDIAVRNNASASGREILDRMLKREVFPKLQ